MSEANLSTKKYVVAGAFCFKTQSHGIISESHQKLGQHLVITVILRLASAKWLSVSTYASARMQETVLQELAEDLDYAIYKKTFAG